MRPLAVTTWVLLCAPLLLSAEERITAEAGQDVTLPCGAGKVNSNTAVEWIRDHLDPDGVLFYREGRFESEGLNPSFRNRVDLQDREMKDGEASLILKNVTIDDTGRYECTVIQGEGNRRKRAAQQTTSIHLVVSPPGTQEGGGEEGGDEYGGPAGRGHPGLVLALVASVLGIVAAVLFLKRKKTPPPPPEGATVQPLV